MSLCPHNCGSDLFFLPLLFYSCTVHVTLAPAWFPPSLPPPALLLHPFTLRFTSLPCDPSPLLPSSCPSFLHLSIPLSSHLRLLLPGSLPRSHFFSNNESSINKFCTLLSLHSVILLSCSCLEIPGRGYGRMGGLNIDISPKIEFRLLTPQFNLSQ